jgi:hypothetical protein
LTAPALIAIHPRLAVGTESTVYPERAEPGESTVFPERAALPESTVVKERKPPPGRVPRRVSEKGGRSPPFLIGGCVALGAWLTRRWLGGGAVRDPPLRRRRYGRFGGN